jgi:hypothetical protein
MKFIGEISAWLRHPKLETRHAVVIAAVILTVGLLVSALISKQIWIAITALSTTLIIIWAIYQEGIRAYRNRPKLKLSLYESACSHLRPIRGVYYLTLDLKNTGHNVAKSVQPFLTQAATLRDGKWVVYENWIPVPLYWLVGQFTSPLLPNQDVVTGAQELVTKRPCYFDIGQFGPEEPDILRLLRPTIYQNQPETYENGLKHCFEITAFAQGTRPHKRYINVFCKGEYTSDPDEMRKGVYISVEDRPPW